MSGLLLKYLSTHNYLRTELGGASMYHIEAPVSGFVPRSDRQRYINSRIVFSMVG